MTDETIEPSLAESRSRKDGIYLIETERVGDQDRYMIWDVGREHYYPGFYLSKSAAIAAIKEQRQPDVQPTGGVTHQGVCHTIRGLVPDPNSASGYRLAHATGVTSPDYVRVPKEPTYAMTQAGEDQAT